jgi:hypothetical protein
MISFVALYLSIYNRYSHHKFPPYRSPQSTTRHPVLVLLQLLDCVVVPLAAYGMGFRAADWLSSLSLRSSHFEIFQRGCSLRAEGEAIMLQSNVAYYCCQYARVEGRLENVQDLGRDDIHNQN